MATHTDLLLSEGVVTLANWELRMLRDLVGEKADALLALHERTGSDKQLDDALDFMALFNKLNFTAPASSTMPETTVRTQVTSAIQAKMRK